MRTQDEIVTRYEAVKGEDFFGFKAEVLVGLLDFEHAKPYLKPEVTEGDWDGAPAKDDGEVYEHAADYLGFAFDKARGHRGVSAARSVDKMEEYLWLLGLDVDRFNAAGYAQYGVPQLAVAAEQLGQPMPEGDDIARMAQGLPCDPEGCYEGCGR